MLKFLTEVIKRQEELFLYYTSESLLFLSLLLTARIFEKCCIIKYFNYPIFLLLSFAGFGIYKLKAAIWRSRTVKIAILTFMFISIAVVCIYLPFQVRLMLGCLKVWYIDGFSAINKAISQGKEIPFYIFLPYFAVLVPVASAFLLSQISKNREYLVIIFYFILILCFWYTGFDYDLRIIIFPCIFIITAIYGISIYNNNIKIAKNEGYSICVNTNRIIFYIMLVSLLVMGTGIGLTAGIGVKSLSQVIESAMGRNIKVKDNIQKNRFDLTSTGYVHYPDRLGGPVWLNGNVAFRVKGDEAVYLRGDVKDYYDGFLWRKTPKDVLKLNGTIAYPYEFYRAISGDDKEINPDIYSEKLKYETLQILPEGLETSTFFAPNYTFSIIPKSGTCGFDDTMSFIVTSKNYINKPYTVNYYKSKNGLEILSKETQITYKSDKWLNDTEKQYYNADVKDKYVKYLQVPQNISPEIYKLVNDITRDCRNSTEKVKSIQEYLSKNYNYSLQVSNVPEGKEFIDYFLFTEKKGYCTYFATAATILCRIAGIPARYVEGFSMMDKKDSRGLYVVENNMAHAWTEVLIQPEGDVWSIVDCVPFTRSDVRNEINYNVSQAAVWADDYYRTEKESDDSGPDVMDDIMEAVQDKFPSNIEMTVLTLLGLLIIVLLTVLVMFSIRIHRKRIYILQILLSESVIPLYGYILKRLKAIGIEGSPTGDDMELAEKVDDEELKQRIKVLVQAVYEEFYGKKSSKWFDKKGLYLYVEGYIRGRQKMLKYYMAKYFNK